MKTGLAIAIFNVACSLEDWCDWLFDLCSCAEKARAADKFVFRINPSTPHAEGEKTANK